MSAVPYRFPFQDLPNELVLSVFKFAAASSFETCLALTLVASWTRVLALPHLYSTVVLTNHNAFTAFGNALRQSNERALLVHNLCDVSGDSSATYATVLDEVLSRCVNATNIAVPAATLHRLAMLIFANFLRTSVLPNLPLVELTIVTPDDSNDVNFRGLDVLQGWLVSIVFPSTESPLTRLLDSITHLDLSCAHDPVMISRVASLFRGLTHLKVLFDYYNDELSLNVQLSFKAYLSPTLKQLVLAPEDEGIFADVAFAAWFWEARREEGRLCISRTRTTAASWEDNIRRRSSIWEMATRETQEWGSTMPKP
ncbi:hypothetical protein PLICRDRAFT_566164 [Plicaturopsis crispa FD-325 SS-3]|nr:hypothetical protein PLICRDRAFT_566164 [Plicaturopsis crispa FD-325 SS-3]